MQVTKKIEWDMGHRVPNHKSKCKNVHGHRYVMEVTLRGPVLAQPGKSDEGMVMDFSDIKEIMKKEIDKLDHAYMSHHLDLEILDVLNKLRLKVVKVDFVPTAENIAGYLFNRLDSYFRTAFGDDLSLENVRIYETPNSFVDYKGY